MQIHTRRPYLAPFTDHVSEHRFRLVMALCLLSIAIMLGAIYSTIGIGPLWAVPAVPVAS
jgi:hypothetical protein